MGLLIPLLTDQGTDMMLDAMNGGNPLTFTRICLGDGTTSAPASATALNHQVIEAAITSATITNKYIRLDAHYSNSGLEAGFYVKEVGVFASSNNIEKLYAYSCEADLTDYIPSYSSGRAVEEDISLIVMIGSSENVSAVISQEYGYAMAIDLNNHIRDYNNPHHVTKESIGLGNVIDAAPSDMTVSFNNITTLESINSGDTLAQLFSKISGVIRHLSNHIKDKDNPHAVTCSQIGAAASGHKHSAADITSGTLPLARGGTGVTSKTALRSLVNRKITYVADNLSATKWTNGTYNLEMSGYDLDVSLAPTATAEQAYIFSRACIVGSQNSNVLTALGTVPSMNIPVIIRKVEVL